MAKRFSAGAETYVTQVHRRRSRRRQILYIAAITVVVYTVIVGIIWLLYRSPVLRIRSIVVAGETSRPHDEIIGGIMGALKEPGDRYRLFWVRNMLSWPGKFEQDRLKSFPEVMEVDVEKRYRAHEIVLHVKEHVPFGIWCRHRNEQEQCFWFDEKGSVYQPSLRAEGSLIPVVHDYSQNPVGLQTKVLPEPMLAHFFTILEVLRETGLAIKETHLDDIELQEIHVDTYEGVRLSFSLRFPAYPALVALNSLRAEPGLTGLQTIDFRVENRVYYK